MSSDRRLVCCLPATLTRMSMAAELVDRGLRRAAAVGLVLQVAGHGDRLAAGLLDQLHDLLGVVLLLGQVGQHDVGALAGERDRGGAADAAVGAGDDGLAPGQAAGAAVGGLPPWSGVGCIRCSRPAPGCSCFQLSSGVGYCFVGSWNVYWSVTPHTVRTSLPRTSSVRWTSGERSAEQVDPRLPGGELELAGAQHVVDARMRAEQQPRTGPAVAELEARGVRLQFAITSIRCASVERVYAHRSGSFSSTPRSRRRRRSRARAAAG